MHHIAETSFLVQLQTIPQLQYFFISPTPEMLKMLIFLSFFKKKKKERNSSGQLNYLLQYFAKNKNSIRNKLLLHKPSSDRFITVTKHYY